MKKFLLSLLFLGAACICSQAQTRTFPYVNGIITAGDCVQFDPTATILDPIISDAGVTCGGGGGGGGTPGGPNHSLEYNNAGAFGGVVILPGHTVVGTATNPIDQSKPVIDARDIVGMHCDGATADDATLNALTGAAPGTNNVITGKRVLFANCPIALANTWVIYNQAGFILDGGTRSGAAGKGTLVTWIGGANGTMIDMEYVDGFVVQGFNIQGNTNAGIGIKVDKNGAGGIWNTTDGILTDNTYAGANQNWQGLSISPVSTQNVEDIRVKDSAFYCNATRASTAAVGILIGASSNAKNEIITHINVTNCLYGIWKKNGSMQVRESEFTGNGGTCGSGAGADIRDDTNSDVDIIDGNLDEGSTQGINVNNDTAGGGPSNPMIVRGNHGAPAGCENLANYWYNVQGGPFWLIEGNSWDADSSLVKIIGSNNAGGASNAHVYTSANVYPNSIFNPWWTLAADSNAEDIGVISDRMLVYPAKTNNEPSAGNNASSPILDFRGYLNGSTSAPDDTAIQNIPASGGGTSGGTFLIKPQQGATGTKFLSWDGSYAGIQLDVIPTPTIGGFSQGGTPGGTSYTYSVVAYGPLGNTIGSPSGTTVTGNATLSLTNFNQIQWYPVAGPVKYCIWRIASGGSPSSLGKIGCTSALQVRSNLYPFNFAVNVGAVTNPYRFNDTGLAGDGSSLPGLNTTGDLYQATGTTHCWNQDTGISRDSADTIDFGNCTPGDTSATLQAGQLKILGSGPSNITLPPSLFAALASCGVSTAGSIDPVSDSTTTTPGATITGGGANDVIAYCNGSNWIVASGSGGVNSITFSAPLSGGTITGSGTVGITGNGIGAAQLAAQYSKLRCEPGLGDGLNAIPAGTYLQFSCVNTSGVTWTVTGISCWTDNAGASTLNAANNAAAGLLTGAVTCNNTKSGGGTAGTQSGTTTLANNDAISFTFVSDGTSKQTTWTVSLTQ